MSKQCRHESNVLHRVHRRRPGGAVLRPADEAAAPRLPRGGGRAQPPLRHLRLGRGAVRPDAAEHAGGRRRKRAPDRRRLQPLGRHRGLLQGPQRALHRTRLLRHRAQAPAQHPAGPLPGAGCRTRVRDRRDRRPGHRRAIRCRPGDRQRWPQQPHPHALPKRVPARHRHAPVPLCLARHPEDLRRLHLRLRADRARLVSGPRLQVRRQHLDLHRRDARGGVESARTGSDEPAGGHRLLREAVRPIPRWPSADQQRDPLARLGHLDPLSARDLQDLGAPRAHRRQDGAHRADGRRGAHGALFHRQRHQTGAGGCHRPGESVRRERRGIRHRRRHRHRAAALRGHAQRGSAEDPERRAQLHRVVRERRPLHGHGDRAVRLFAAHAQPAHQPREPAPARCGLARGLRALVRAHPAGAPGS